MQFRTLGNSDLQLSIIGLGTWAIGGSDWSFAWGPQDDQESIAAIHRALDLGINWIDTAPVYGLGHCEEVVGRAIQDLKQRPLIATKCGRVWNDAREISVRIKRASIQKELEDSLRRLGIDVIDLYQIHWPEPDEDIEEAWETVNTFVKQGKVRYAGVSNFNVQQLHRIQPIAPVTSLQPPYSMLVRKVETEILPFCEQNKIGVIPYSPMQKGLLTGKVTKEWVNHLPASDHRRNDPQFNEPRLTVNINLVKELSAIAEQAGKTMAQLAIAWVLSLSAVTAAIVGARKPSQIEEIIGAADWTLTSEQRSAIEEALHRREQQIAG